MAPTEDIESGIPLISAARTKCGVLIVVCGLYACFLVSTVMQEKLYALRGKSHEEYGDRFESAPLLTLVKSLTSVFVSRTVIYFRKNSGRITPTGPAALTTAIVRFSSTLMSLYSLNFISYPHLVIGKSVKMFPVLVSDCVFHRRYPSLRRFASVSATTLGMLLFSLPSITDKGENDDTTGYVGIFLIFMSLCADGLLSLSQSKMVKESGEKPRVFETMLYMSSWQALLSFLIVVLSWGEKGGVYFCMSNPGVLQLLLFPALIESIGQVFVYELVINHGPLFTALVTTLRKFVTLVISVMLFGHSVSFTQWVAIGIVFIGVSADALAHR